MYEKVVEDIEVKGVGSVQETFLNSVYGPVSMDGNKYYSLMWAPLGPTDTSVEGMYLTNIATNWEEFRLGCAGWVGMLFNAAYGDVEGNIGIQILGKLPIRVEGDRGLVPRLGNGTYDWKTM